MSPFPVILSSPSGGGKTTIAQALIDVRADVGYSVSCTTREPRPGEVDGTDYFFLPRGDFERRLAAGAFAESAEVHGQLYGTLRAEIERVTGLGRHVILDIDVQGAAQLRRAFPGAVTIFVLPPSADVLLDRLRRRQTESPAGLASRLRSALLELQSVGAYDYVVINDTLTDAIGRVSSIIDAESVRRHRLAGLNAQVAALIDNLEREIDQHSSFEKTS
jgi:guanylate kinase